MRIFSTSIVSTLFAVLLSSCVVDTDVDGVVGDETLGEADSELVVGPTYAVNVTVSGLPGSPYLLLYNNNTPITTIKNGTFTFAKRLSPGDTYFVMALPHEKAPARTCVVENGMGTIANADITDVKVTCRMNPAYRVLATVRGLTGPVVLQNGIDQVSAAANGTYAFPIKLPAGWPYSITTVATPAALSQTCTVSNSDGNMGSADVTNVVVDCTTPVL